MTTDALLVHHITADGTLVRLDLPAGATARFGRGSGDTPVELALAHAGLPAVAGEIRAAGGHWALSNLSHDRTLVVENPEGAGEHMKVAPRRTGAPVPFEIGRVVLPARPGFVTFNVFAPAHAYLARHTAPDVFPLDESAKYFLVLVALCEPRLRDQSHVAIPTVAQVVRRLRPLRSCARLTEAAVTFHVDYLARTKLPLEPAGAAHRLITKRAAMVSLALRFDLVREEHLALLPQRAPGAPGTR